MADQTEPPVPGYATLSLTHHAMHRERAEALRRRRGRAKAQPECLSIGHAWKEDPAREGGTICLVCEVVRWP